MTELSPEVVPANFVTGDLPGNVQPAISAAHCLAAQRWDCQAGLGS